MKNILEKLFGSKSRIKILCLFVKNPDSAFYVREITRKLKERINSIRRELANLEKNSILKSFKKDKKKYYTLNHSCIIVDELSALILKSSIVSKEKVTQEIKKLGNVYFAALSGIFTRSSSKVDLLMVSDNIKKNKLTKVINSLEKQQGQELNYTIMSKREFRHRKNVDDRFLKSITDDKHQVLIDRTPEEKIKKQENLLGMKLGRISRPRT